MPSQKKFSLKQLLPGLKKAGSSNSGSTKGNAKAVGCAIAFILFLLIGSVGAMLS